MKISFIFILMMLSTSALANKLYCYGDDYYMLLDIRAETFSILRKHHTQYTGQGMNEEVISGDLNCYERVDKEHKKYGREYLSMTDIECHSALNRPFSRMIDDEYYELTQLDLKFKVFEHKYILAETLFSEHTNSYMDHLYCRMPGQPVVNFYPWYSRMRLN